MSENARSGCSFSRATPKLAKKKNVMSFLLTTPRSPKQSLFSTSQVSTMNQLWFRTAFLGLVISANVIAEPIVHLDTSKVAYRGVARGSVEDFHNIKFAHDTSGQRRFAPPEPYTPPDGTEIDGTSPGPACPQFQAAIPPFFDETPSISEDCLHLRITRPTGTTTNDRLPVVVHLVGGGVVRGSTYDSHFDPINLITHSISIEKPIIVSKIDFSDTFTYGPPTNCYLIACCPELSSYRLWIRSPPHP